MILDTNKSLHYLETLSAVAHIPAFDMPIYSTIRRGFKLYKFETNIRAIPFSQFIKAAKYYGDISTASKFIAAINDMDTDFIGTFSIKKIYGLWLQYNIDFQKCIDSFKEQQDLIISTQKEGLYDFSEFGLKQIIKFLSGGVKSEEDIYEATVVRRVMVDYRFKIKQTENYNYAQKQAQ